MNYRFNEMLVRGTCCILLVSFTGCQNTEHSMTIENPDASTTTQPIIDEGESEAVASQTDPVENTKSETVRFATFNVSMNREKEGELKTELASSDSSKSKQIAEIIQTVRPDVILLNEFDYDAEGAGVTSFQENFLGESQNGKEPIEYEFTYFQAVNTGVDSGFDLNRDDKKGTANDAYGFGQFPGKYGMVVLSNYPIDWDQVRTFQNFLWKDMPNLMWPTNPKTDNPYYSPEIKDIFRLSSKSHWDIPIKIGDRTIHFLVCHPTPPVFDGDEDRNGKRNHDEIRFWADYVTGDFNYHYDDSENQGGLTKGSDFVIAGDMNADPVDGDSSVNAAQQLTQHPLINSSFTPQSSGGEFYAAEQGRKNKTQKGNPAHDTGDFNDQSVGNVRVDYCLPSKSLKIAGSGVFWPRPDEPGGKLVKASDHRMVWIDVVK